jgi:16S rRNA G966 N2-methylase RsmD
MIDRAKVIKKFGHAFDVDDETYVMGVNHLLSENIAKRFIHHKAVLDTCCGAGFMSVAIAKYAGKVIAVDIDHNHLSQARNNATLASAENIDFVLGDILKILTNGKLQKIDAAFLDPDWAKPNSKKTAHVSMLSDMQPSAEILFNETSRMTKNICLRLPKEIDIAELKKLPPHELEPIHLDNELKFYCAYFGDLINK